MQTRKAHAIRNWASWVCRVAKSVGMVVIAPCSFVSAQHHEALGKGDGLAGEFASRQVVRDCAAVRDIDEAAIGILIV